MLSGDINVTVTLIQIARNTQLSKHGVFPVEFYKLIMKKKVDEKKAN
jgi:hypothetical protein